MSKEAMKQALEAYCKTLHPLWNTRISRTEAEDFFEAGFKAAIAEAEKQEQGEPERCHGCEACINTACGRDECPKGWPKAPQPAQKPLTDEQIKKVWCIHDDDDDPDNIFFERDITRAIEAAHGIKS